MLTSLLNVAKTEAKSLWEDNRKGCGKTVSSWSQFFLVASQHDHLLNTHSSTHHILVDSTPSWKEDNLPHERIKSGTVPSAATEHITVFQSVNDKKAADVHFREKRDLWAAKIKSLCASGTFLFSIFNHLLLIKKDSSASVQPQLPEC